MDKLRYLILLFVELKICPFSEVKLIVNGAEISGNCAHVNKGDMILVKALRGDKWGFSFDDAKIGIPFMESYRMRGDKWLLLGSFGDGCGMNDLYGPEISVQFNMPYVTAEWKKTFWRLGSGDYVRPYVDSCFFSQWFYALMVGHFGLIDAAKALDCREYKEYFTDSMRNLSQFFEYMNYEYKEFGQPTFIQKGMRLKDLDSIGTMGMNLCELYKIYPAADVMLLITWNNLHQSLNLTQLTIMN